MASTHARAGAAPGGSQSAHARLTSERFARSLTKIIANSMSSRVQPAFMRYFSTLFIASKVCSYGEAAALSGTCPETNTNWPDATALLSFSVVSKRVMSNIQNSLLEEGIFRSCARHAIKNLGGPNNSNLMGVRGSNLNKRYIRREKHLRSRRQPVQARKIPRSPFWRDVRDLLVREARRLTQRLSRTAVLKMCRCNARIP